MGIVRTDTMEHIATIFDATPVSFPYFAENITVLLALGTDADIIQAVRSAPDIPTSLKMPYIARGKMIVLRKITR